jgi:methyl-accepting chemotaxis protein
MATTSAASAPQVSPIARKDYSSSLHRRFLVGATVCGILTIGLLAGGAWTLLQGDIARRGDQTLHEAAHRADLVIASALQERGRESQVLALTPQVIAAARQGLARSAALGLPGTPIPTLEQRFAADKSMLVAADTRLRLRELVPHLDAEQVILTDSSGYNVLITDRSADFVQSDEAWWQEAWRTGRSISDAAYDSATRTSVVAVAVTVVDGAAKLGVLKVKFVVTPLVSSLASAGAGVRVDIVDSAGRVLLSSDSTAMGSVLARVSGDAASEHGTVTVGSVVEQAATRTATGTRWTIVAHLPSATLAAPYEAAKRGILGATAALLLVLAGLIFAMHRFLTRRISDPVSQLAAAAEAVAAGDFSVQVRHVSTDDEIGRTARAVAAMVVELRRLAQAIVQSTHETNTMSSDITAGSEEMAATAGEIANTASELSAQATRMAETIGSLAVTAGSLRGLATELETGAGEGVTRNAALRTLATENRSGLDASAASLDTLGNDVLASAQAIEALAEASTEIRSFVTLVRKLARQSKLLALNAAMEAARAGAQGEGFAVVASEVRRLSSMSSDAAERTEAVVNSVLSGIEASRASAGRAVAMADEVRVANARASASFAEIEVAVAEADSWTRSVQQTSSTTRELMAVMTERLDDLTGGTESFAAAMEQVAASSEEQSAATQEIAGAANTLVAAADRLNRLVAGLKLGDAEPARGSAIEPAADAGGSRHAAAELSLSMA